VDVKTVTRTDPASIVAAVESLAKKRVLVGIPADSDKNTRASGPMTNAALGYIHENGAPSVNIPARPFLVPGVQNAQSAMTPHLEAAARAAVAGDEQKMLQALNAVGLVAQNAVKAKITDGPFEPLKPGTVARRMRTKARRRRKVVTASADAHPLIDTGQLRNSITYVVRDA
jgi:hypothetical protein